MLKHLTTITLGLCLTVPASPVTVQCEEKPYIINHYDLTIKPDFVAKTLSVEGTIVIDNPELRPDFSFGLNDRFTSVELTSPSSSVTVERGGGWCTATLTTPGKTVTLHFSLKGAPGASNDVGREVIADSTLFLLWSDRFYPIDFDHWSTVTTTILLPRNFQTIAPGLLKQTRKTDRGIEYRFETSRPTVCFSVFADSRWISTERTINGIRMQTLLYPESQRFAGQIFGTSSEILAFYSATYSPFPFDQFAFVSISGLDARRAFDGFIGYEPRYLERELNTTGHDAHETALLWWCYTLRGSGKGAFQWTEGFGDYAEILYGEKYHKPIPAIFARFRSEYLKLSAEQDLLYGDLKGNTPQNMIHGKYPWLMHVLRFVVGDTAFQRGMKLLFERFSFRTFTMEEYIAVLEEGCGQSLTWWRDEWLNRRGVPEIAFASAVEREGNHYRVTCTIDQKGGLYHLPLEIGIATASGMNLEKVRMSEKHTARTFTSEQKPTGIVLDPNGWILMKKTTE